MKVLIIGDPNSIWIKSTVEHTLLPFHEEVTLIPRIAVLQNLDFYDINSVKIVPLPRTKGVFGTIKQIACVMPVFKDRYDVFCIHFVLKKAVFLLPLAKLFCKRTILIFWGSDILREKKYHFYKAIAFHLADRLCLSTDEMVEKFHQLYGTKYDKKIRRMAFGANGIEVLKSLRLSSEDIRMRYGIGQDKIVVSVGYNRMVQQQHIEVLREIKALPAEARARIHLLFRLTYGNGSPEYIQEVKTQIEETGCTNSVFESYLSDEEVAELTCITDVFIHAQTTDARSASMCEHLYAKCLVINPSWIHYSELADQVFYLTFDQFDDLKTMIKDNLVRKENSPYIDRLNANPKAIADLVSWDAHVQEWRDIYTKWD